MRIHTAIPSFILVLFLCGSVSAGQLEKDMVPDSATAIKVAAAILETYMGRDRFAAMIKREPLVADLNGGIWAVYPYPSTADIRKEDQSGGSTILHVVTGGGQPILKISKHDAQVLDLYYGK